MLLNLSQSRGFGYGRTVLSIWSGIFLFLFYKLRKLYVCFCHNDCQYLTVTVVGLDFECFGDQIEAGDGAMSEIHEFLFSCLLLLHLDVPIDYI